MQINRNNYEQILTDYFDGQLGPVETACLMAFLEENPDIHEEFKSFDCVHLGDAEKCCFHEKHLLKRTIIPEQNIITEDNYLQIFFDDEEGLLNENMKQHLKSFLHKNPSLQPEFYSWRYAHLIPETIVYDDKAGLKKSPFFYVYDLNSSFARVAAAVALLVVAGIILISNLNNQPLPALSFQGVQPSGLHLRQSSAVNEKNTGAELVSPGALANEHHQKNVNTGSPDKQLPQLADAPLPITKMTETRVFAGLMEDLPVAPNTLEGYQTEYTEIMELMEARLKLRKQETQVPQVADRNVNPSNESGFNDARINFWDIAELGVAGYNAFSAKDVNFKRRTDSRGRTSSVSLGSFAYEKKRK